ncbi:hypothetical protein G6O67_005552 [Ophiocordyceps sinensis]|uniref:Uncharacterized protein n=1 Tax=Ophiocordyceps sinensis TaxID=72228 RepID=A0A8H4V611_9HYPO|nr:hypothetical protein G6O67_005552 [Ophiocordyceps sinensis]
MCGTAEADDGCRRLCVMVGAHPPKARCTSTSAVSPGSHWASFVFVISRLLAHDGAVDHRTLCIEYVMLDLACCPLLCCSHDDGPGSLRQTSRFSLVPQGR